MLPFRKLILFGALLPLASVHAQEPANVTEVVAAVEQVYQNAESLRADFVQVTRSLGEEQKQRGRVVFKRPRKMRWEFTAPDKKEFVTDGQTIWIWSPKENQVIVYKDLSGASNEMAGLLTDLNQIDELFQVQLVENGKANYVLDLQPKKQGNMKKIRVEVTRQQYLVEHVQLTDQFDVVTDLSFSQVNLNPKVTDGEFTFTIPKGAQVINPEGN